MTRINGDIKTFSRTCWFSYLHCEGKNGGKGSEKGMLGNYRKQGCPRTRLNKMEPVSCYEFNYISFLYGRIFYEDKRTIITLLHAVLLFILF